MFGLMADSDYRVHTRRRPGDMKVLVDGVPCMLLDYSNGGVRISTTHFMRRVALVEVYRGRRLVKKSAAVVAWRHGDQIGYAFRDKLKLCEVEAASAAPQVRSSAPAPEAGSISGSALRRRLNL